jgi:hypothetical protein
MPLVLDVGNNSILQIVIEFSRQAADKASASDKIVSHDLEECRIVAILPLSIFIKPHLPPVDLIGSPIDERWGL